MPNDGANMRNGGAFYVNDQLIGNPQISGIFLWKTN